MSRLISSFLVLMMTSLLTVGCGSTETSWDTTGLSFKKNGEIVHLIVEDFAEEYYSLEELKAGVEEQIAAYNGTNGEDRIRLDTTELTDGKVRMQMTFDRASSYTGFYRQALFCGTIEEAQRAGYDLDVALSSVDDSDSKIGRTDILEMGDRHIIIAREAISFRPFAEILYTSGDVSVSDNRKEAFTENGENLSYIIFK